MVTVTTEHRDTLGFLMLGEGRLVFARYRHQPTESFYLEDGAAGEPGMRDFVRDQLECLLPGCSDRRLHLVNRHGGRRQQRDGFRHTSGTGGHSVESLFHAQGKLRVQQWLRDSRPDLRVELEATTDDRSRRADVLVTWPDGRVVAIEIQYSPLPINGWLLRHRSYRRQGITDVWLFGSKAVDLDHHGYRDGRPRIGLSPLLRTCVDENVPIYWIDPVEGAVVTPFIELRLKTGSGAWRAPVPSGIASGFFAVDPLDQECTIDPDQGITTPTLRAALEERAAYDQALVEWNEMMAWEAEGEEDSAEDVDPSDGDEQRRSSTPQTVQGQLVTAEDVAHDELRRRVREDRERRPKVWERRWK